MFRRLIVPGSSTVRAVRPGDAAALSTLMAAVAQSSRAPAGAPTPEARDDVPEGRVWVAASGRSLHGYVALSALPGLPGLVDLTGGVTPKRRRQGLGGQLLAHAVGHAPALGARHLSARVERLEDDTARFLLRRDFTVGHEECLLELYDLSALPPVPDAPGLAVVTLPRERAIAEFIRLYDQSFAGRPWSQPYTEAEVAAGLGRAEDLLFAMRGGVPVGVVWSERLPNGRGRIEPIGVVSAHQGQGYGRRLLLAALRNLRRQGATVVEIGLWRDNAAAMHLYKSLGFREVANWYYLARDLPLNVE